MVGGGYFCREVTGRCSMVVDIMCWLYWSVGCPNITGNIILGVSVNVFPYDINIWVGRLSKADYPHQCEWASCNPLETWKVRENLFSLLYRFLAGTSIFFYPQLCWFSGIQSQPGIYTISSVASELYHQLFWVSSLPRQSLGLLSPHNDINQHCITD